MQSVDTNNPAITWLRECFLKRTLAQLTGIRMRKKGRNLKPPNTTIAVKILESVAVWRLIFQKKVIMVITTSIMKPLSTYT